MVKMRKTRKKGIHKNRIYLGTGPHSHNKHALCKLWQYQLIKADFMWSYNESLVRLSFNKTLTRQFGMPSNIKAATLGFCHT